MRSSTRLLINGTIIICLIDRAFYPSALENLQSDGGYYVGERSSCTLSIQAQTKPWVPAFLAR